MAECTQGPKDRDNSISFTLKASEEGVFARSSLALNSLAFARRRFEESRRRIQEYEDSRKCIPYRNKELDPKRKTVTKAVHISKAEGYFLILDTTKKADDCS